MFLRVVLFLILFCSSAFAACDVELSFIKGSSEEAKSDQIDATVLEQLKNLPFTAYSLLKKEKQTLSFNQVSHFSQGTEKEENKVAITPLKVEGEKVQALIEWTVPEGENILSSKIWLTNGGNMVFGADDGNARCTVINVAIKCE